MNHLVHTLIMLATVLGVVFGAFLLLLALDTLLYRHSNDERWNR